jgi:dextranase
MGTELPQTTDFRVTPDRGTYAPGELVTLIVSTESSIITRVDLETKLFQGMDLVGRQEKVWELKIGKNQTNLQIQPGLAIPAGYGVDVFLYPTDSNEPFSKCQTAFDVLEDWTVFPRYGFVCDFSPARSNVEETIGTLTRFHLNGLQFYDWQYRHDTLVPPQDDYLDPLGRSLSLNLIRDLIAAAHAHGMKAMPYLAIYAASASFWKDHLEWALYDRDHQAIPFGENFLGIMNPVAGGEWSRHLLGECENVLKQLPFDGLHIDQYGDPKTGYDFYTQPVDLPKAFNDFIQAAVKQHPQIPVLFNAVGNWPIESLAKAPTAFNYIEIWPPKTSYTDLAGIVRNASQLSGGKPVVIALYIPANRYINIRLADAMVMSAGGTRIELGETGRLLSDPYFPKHEAMDPRLSDSLRRQIELIIRYANWISPLVPEIYLPIPKLPRGIEYFLRKTTKGYSISLVNLSADQPLHWNEDHVQPEVKWDFTIEIQMDEPVRNVWMVSPDFDFLTPVSLKFNHIKDFLTVEIPSLEVWDVILIETMKM